MGLLYTLEELQSVVADWRRQGLRVGFTCGAFDLLHAGHAHYLQRARVLCDRLIVGVNTDASIRAYKNPLRPIIGEQHRAALVAALACTDAVTLMHEARPAVLIEALRPDLYVKGGDYTVDQLRSAPLVESYGGRCAVIPVEHDISTSAIVRRIEELSWYARPSSGDSKPGMPIVFLDRDGTLIENVHFLNDVTRVRLRPGVGEGLRALQEGGYRLVIVSNQQGLGLGYFDYDAFVKVNSEMLRQLAPFGVSISRFYFCPHSLGDECACRKPGAELLRRALADYAAEAARCWMIGDSMADVTAAERAGCRAVLLSAEKDKHVRTVRLAADFGMAAEVILNASPEPARS